MNIRPGAAGALLTPHAAGWYAGEVPHASYYGPPLRLAPRRAPLRREPGMVPVDRDGADAGAPTGHRHRADPRAQPRGWRTAFRAGLGLPPGDSAIVSVELPEAEERLRGSRVMAAARAGLLRTAWHVYNTDDDVRELLELLGR